MEHKQSQLVYVSISEINVMMANDMTESAFSYVDMAGVQVMLFDHVEYRISDTSIMRFEHNRPTHHAKAA